MVLVDVFKEAQHVGEVPPGYNPALTTKQPIISNNGVSRSGGGYIIHAGEEFVVVQKEHSALIFTSSSKRLASSLLASFNLLSFFDCSFATI